MEKRRRSGKGLPPRRSPRTTTTPPLRPAAAPPSVEDAAKTKDTKDGGGAELCSEESSEVPPLPPSATAASRAYKASAVSFVEAQQPPAPRLLVGKEKKAENSRAAGTLSMPPAESSEVFLSAPGAASFNNSSEKAPSTPSLDPRVNKEAELPSGGATSVANAGVRRSSRLQSAGAAASLADGKASPPSAPPSGAARPCASEPHSGVSSAVASRTSTETAKCEEDAGLRLLREEAANSSQTALLPAVSPQAEGAAGFALREAETGAAAASRTRTSKPRRGFGEFSAGKKTSTSSGRLRPEREGAPWRLKTVSLEEVSKRREVPLAKAPVLSERAAEWRDRIRRSVREARLAYMAERRGGGADAEVSSSCKTGAGRQLWLPQIYAKFLGRGREHLSPESDRGLYFSIVKAVKGLVSPHIEAVELHDHRHPLRLATPLESPVFSLRYVGPPLGPDSPRVVFGERVGLVVSRGERRKGATKADASAGSPLVGKEAAPAPVEAKAAKAKDKDKDKDKDKEKEKEKDKEKTARCKAGSAAASSAETSGAAIETAAGGVGHFCSDSPSGEADEEEEDFDEDAFSLDATSGSVQLPFCAAALVDANFAMAELQMRADAFLSTEEKQLLMGLRPPSPPASRRKGGSGSSAKGDSATAGVAAEALGGPYLDEEGTRRERFKEDYKDEEALVDWDLSRIDATLPDEEAVCVSRRGVGRLPADGEFKLYAEAGLNALSLVPHFQLNSVFGFARGSLNCEWILVWVDGWPHVLLSSLPGVKLSPGDELRADFGAAFFEGFNCASLRYARSCLRELRLIQLKAFKTDEKGVPRALPGPLQALESADFEEEGTCFTPDQLCAICLSNEAPSPPLEAKGQKPSFASEFGEGGEKASAAVEATEGEDEEEEEESRSRGIVCDGCNRAFHLCCLRIEAVPSEDFEWFCPLCVALARRILAKELAAAPSPAAAGEPQSGEKAPSSAVEERHLADSAKAEAEGRSSTPAEQEPPTEGREDSLEETDSIAKPDENASDENDKALLAPVKTDESGGTWQSLKFSPDENAPPAEAVGDEDKKMEFETGASGETAGLPAKEAPAAEGEGAEDLFSSAALLASPCAPPASSAPEAAEASSSGESLKVPAGSSPPSEEGSATGPASASGFVKSSLAEKERTVFASPALAWDFAAGGGMASEANDGSLLRLLRKGEEGEGLEGLESDFATLPSESVHFQSLRACEACLARFGSDASPIACRIHKLHFAASSSGDAQPPMEVARSVIKAQGGPLPPEAAAACLREMSEPGGERFVPLLGVYLNETKIERRFQEGLFVGTVRGLVRDREDGSPWMLVEYEDGDRECMGVRYFLLEQLFQALRPKHFPTATSFDRLIRADIQKYLFLEGKPRARPAVSFSSFHSDLCLPLKQEQAFQGFPLADPWDRASSHSLRRQEEADGYFAASRKRRFAESAEAEAGASPRVSRRRSAGGFEAEGPFSSTFPPGPSSARGGGAGGTRKARAFDGGGDGDALGVSPSADAGADASSSLLRGGWPSDTSSPLPPDGVFGGGRVSAFPPSRNSAGSLSEEGNAGEEALPPGRVWFEAAEDCYFAEFLEANGQISCRRFPVYKGDRAKAETLARRCARLPPPGLGNSTDALLAATAGAAVHQSLHQPPASFGHSSHRPARRAPRTSATTSPVDPVWRPGGGSGFGYRKKTKAAAAFARKGGTGRQPRRGGAASRALLSETEESETDFSLAESSVDEEFDEAPSPGGGGGGNCALYAATAAAASKQRTSSAALGPPSSTALSARASQFSAPPSSPREGPVSGFPPAVGFPPPESGEFAAASSASSWSLPPSAKGGGFPPPESGQSSVCQGALYRQRGGEGADGEGFLGVVPSTPAEKQRICRETLLSLARYKTVWRYGASGEVFHSHFGKLSGSLLLEGPELEEYWSLTDSLLKRIGFSPAVSGQAALDAKIKDACAANSAAVTEFLEALNKGAKRNSAPAEEERPPPSPPERAATSAAAGEGSDFLLGRAEEGPPPTPTWIPAGERPLSPCAASAPVASCGIGSSHGFEEEREGLSSRSPGGLLSVRGGGGVCATSGAPFLVDSPNRLSPSREESSSACVRGEAEAAVDSVVVSFFNPREDGSSSSPQAQEGTAGEGGANVKPSAEASPATNAASDERCPEGAALVGRSLVKSVSGDARAGEDGGAVRLSHLSESAGDPRKAPLPSVSLEETTPPPQVLSGKEGSSAP